MILPERTVDAWTASYITGRRWRARLWAPTERRPGEKYDLGVGIGNVAGFPVPQHRDCWPDKVFALEHKGVYRGPGGSPIIWIRVRQLLDHLDDDRARGGGLVYYLLPDPEWTNPQRAPVGTLPDVAVRRTRGPKLPTRGYSWDGFQWWARVAHVEDVYRRMLQISNGAPHRFESGSGGDWACALRMREVGGLRNQVSLRDFLSGVRRCTHGRLVDDEELRNPQPITGGPSSGRLGSTLGSLEDALRSAAKDRKGDEGPVDDAGEALQAEPGKDDLLEVFERPAFTTVYGVGDSDHVVDQASKADSLF